MKDNTLIKYASTSFATLILLLAFCHVQAKAGERYYDCSSRMAGFTPVKRFVCQGSEITGSSSTKIHLRPGATVRLHAKCDNGDKSVYKFHKSYSISKLPKHVHCFLVDSNYESCTNWNGHSRHITLNSVTCKVPSGF